MGSADGSPLDGELERKVLAFMTEEIAIGPLVVHHEPSDAMRARMPGLLSRYGEALRHLSARMAMSLRGPFHVFVYESVDQLQKLSGLIAGGFAARGVIHVPHDLDPHHELAHQFATQWNEPQNDPVPTDETSFRFEQPVDVFLTEALAVAMSPLGTLGVPNREWMSFCLRLGADPDLAELRDRFVTCPDGMDAYMTAGSFAEYLIAAYGIRKFKEWYHRRNTVVQIYGKPIASLAGEWRAWVKGVPGDPFMIARAVPHRIVLTRRLTGVRGRVRCIGAANDWFVLWHNGLEIGGGWAWWWPRSFDLELTGDDELRVLAMNGGFGPHIRIEVTRPDGEVVCVSHEGWSASDLEGRPLTVYESDGVVGWAGHFSAEGRTRAMSLKGRVVWAK